MNYQNNTKNRDDGRYLLLDQTSAFEKSQRRDYFRVPVRFKAAICEYRDHVLDVLPLHLDVLGTPELERVETRNISVSGILLETKRMYMPGEKYLLQLFFDGPKHKSSPFAIFAEVMRTIPGKNPNSHQVGMQFFGKTEIMNESLARFVLTQQQKQVQRRRLVERDIRVDAAWH